MRHAIADQRPLMYSPVTIARSEATGEKTPAYNAPTAFQASVAPASGRLDAEAYGQRLPYVKRLYGASAALTEGDGVWVDESSNGPPDYVVIGADRYPREVVYSIGKRGVFGG